jgi:outer membrane putative beta-barrel porin/alpha-amylase
MLKLILCAVLALFLFLPVSLQAQTTNPCAAASQTLACTIPQVYGAGGLSGSGAFVDSAHQGHFDNSFNTSLAVPLNSGIASQLTLLPLAAPASGIALTFDKSLGVFVASNESFGPILSERSGTLGRHRFFVGASYQFFNFKSIDGMSLKSIPAVLTHADDPNDNAPATCSINTTSNKKGCGFVRDVVTTQNSISLYMNQYTGFVAFGLTKNIDLSMAIPVLTVRMSATSDATIVDNSGSRDHEFQPRANCPNVASDGNCLEQLFSPGGRHSTGIGDVTLRVKGTVWKGEHAGLAAGLDVRLPTGDKLNFQGSGTTGVRPFAVWSYSARISPHVNVGYEANGDSVLAGDLSTGTKGHIPNQFLYSAGAEARVVKQVTLALDLIGQVVLNGQQVTVGQKPFLGPCDTPIFTPPSTVGCLAPLAPVQRTTLLQNQGNYTITSAATGLRINVFKQLLLSGNVLIKLDKGGLRANVVPLVSASYTFK